MLADVKTAFLYGDARRSVYVELPPEDLSLHAHFTPLPDMTPGRFGSAVLSLYVRFTPPLEEAHREIGIEVELDGIALDDIAGISRCVIVSSALGTGTSPDKSASPFALPDT